MILADKIIRLRKKNGWSQEELAEKLNVSRQAVSKWEAAQTTPDLEKILQLSNLFGVTTDYLLKDEFEEEEFVESASDSTVRRVSLAEANEFLESRKDASFKIAIATFLCIVSVIPLFILIALGELTNSFLSSNQVLGEGIGVVTILAVVAFAVSVFVRVGLKNSPYEFLEKEPFETEYGVVGLVRERQKSYRPTYVKYNVLGATLCVLSPIPLISAAFLGNDFLVLLMLCVMLIIVAIGVMLFIIAGVRWASTEKLLKEGEFSLREGEFSKKGKIHEAVDSIYWSIVTAGYLLWSFLSGDWRITWIVWPVAAILFSVVEIILKLCVDNKNKE